MIDGKIKGYFLLGQNPAVGSAHGRAQRLGMANLDWLVVRDLFMIESATFWKDGPEIETGEIVPERVPHRGVLPAGRLARGEGGHLHPDPADAAVAGEGRRPAGRRPLRAVVLLPPRAAIIRERLAGSDAAARPGAARPDLGLPDARSARRAERRGGAAGDQRVRGGDRPAAVRLHRAASDDGSTAGGCWIYTGVYADGVNQAARRKPGREQDWVAAEWGWAWPANRRILYNRASADPEGRPWSERKALRLVGRGRRASGPATTCRTSRRPSRRPTGRRRAPSGRRASPATTRSSCRATARAGCTRPAGLLDGPLPTHYEPAESPVRNPLYGQQANPTRKVYAQPENPLNPSPPQEHSRGLPVRVHHQPAHRAPHGRRDEPDAGATWPSCSRRCSSRCRRSWPPSAG